MNIEFEALKRIGNNLEHHYPENIRDFNILKQALQRLEAIENANPSEALECLEQLAEMADKCWVSCDVHKWKNTIKQALIKAQEQEKVLKIIKEKNVDVYILNDLGTLEEYNEWVLKKYGTYYQLTKEEFELLKEYFK